MQDTIRNATLEDLAALLSDQHARKLDMVVPATAVRAEGGNLVVSGASPVIEDDGVTDPNGTYRPTAICDEGIADKLSVPLAYVRRMRADGRPDLFDANVNGWLHGHTAPYWPDAPMSHYAPDPRSFMLRTFRGGDGQDGIARAFLSDRFGIYDNLDVLTAALSGIRDSGVPVEIQGCDLSERRMYVRVFSPAVAVYADDFLTGYRSPFDASGRRAGAVGNALGAPGHEFKPHAVFAGFEISNSEVGDGAFSLCPRFVVEICSNGLKITQDVLRRVHLGGKLDHGVIRFSDDTQRKNLDLVAAQARDAVSTFLDVEYVREKIAELTETAAKPLDDAAKTIEVIGKKLSFGEETTRGVLDHFIRAGQVTAGGVLQAVTSYAQVVVDADSAADLEGKAIDAMMLAAA